MILAHHVADDAGRLLVRPVPLVPVLVHRVEDAAVDRLQTVPRVRQRTRHDDRHRVAEEGLLHLGRDRNARDATAAGPAAGVHRTVRTAVVAHEEGLPAVEGVAL